MQGCAFLLITLPEQKFILTHVSAHLSNRVGAHSRQFLWLLYGADQDACDQHAETTAGGTSQCVLRICMCFVH